MFIVFWILSSWDLKRAARGPNHPGPSLPALYMCITRNRARHSGKFRGEQDGVTHCAALVPHQFEFTGFQPFRVRS